MPVIRKILVTAAVLAFTIISAYPASSQPLAPSSSDALTGINVVRGFHAFTGTGFSGPDAWFDGNVGACTYVGANWNDRIRSARTESARRVELWDNANCTGGAIVIDSSGYNSIGAWVSAYRIE